MLNYKELQRFVASQSNVQFCKNLKGHSGAG